MEATLEPNMLTKSSMAGVHKLGAEWYERRSGPWPQWCVWRRIIEASCPPGWDLGPERAGTPPEHLCMSMPGHTGTSVVGDKPRVVTG